MFSLGVRKNMVMVRGSNVTIMVQLYVMIVVTRIRHHMYCRDSVNVYSIRNCCQGLNGCQIQFEHYFRKCHRVRVCVSCHMCRLGQGLFPCHDWTEFQEMSYGVYML